MVYCSTRDHTVSVSAAQAIARGISPDGGLYLPKSLPKLDIVRLRALLETDYRARACDILGDFLPDFGAGELRECVEAAYGDNFASDKITPLSKLSPNAYMLELWHGPTAAFKDLALQLLPHLLTRSAKKTIGEKTVNILVATSGDTGKAALEGFKDVPGTNILVFYPEQGVSRVQKLQMSTQAGGNVGVCGVYGNFDDTQTAVKQIFTDPQMAVKLDTRDAIFSSANSINWGRLAPQIVYYVSAYCEMVNGGEIELGDSVNVAVPTGNFGNILAAYYAKLMGLPIGRLICASNQNNVLTDFIRTGIYDKRRDFHMTSSPSMDILISSNLERLLYNLSEDDRLVADLMGRLSREGVYELPAPLNDKLKADFYGGFCTEAETAAAIKHTFDEYNYLCETHTAVALKVYRDYAKETGDSTKTIVASTASPFKFAGSILAALTGKNSGEDEFKQLRALAEITGIVPPVNITELEGKSPRFAQTCAKEEMPGVVAQMLGL